MTLFPPADPQWLISLSWCDAYEYTGCPRALGSWLLEGTQMVVRTQEVRGCLDFLRDSSSQYWDDEHGIWLGFLRLHLGYFVVLKIICLVKNLSMNINGLRMEIGNQPFNGARLILQQCLRISDENCVAVGFLLLGRTTREALSSWKGLLVLWGFLRSM